MVKQVFQIQESFSGIATFRILYLDIWRKQSLNVSNKERPHCFVKARTLFKILIPSRVLSLPGKPGLLKDLFLAQWLVCRDLISSMEFFLQIHKIKIYES